MPAAPWPRRSCAYADFAPETDSSRPTRRLRATGSAAPTPPESPALSPPTLRLCFGLGFGFDFSLDFSFDFSLGLRNLIGQRAQLTLVEHRRVHHADQHLFDGAVAEPVDDALDGFRRNPRAGLGGLIDIGAPIHGMGGVALVFQPSQHGADRGFFQRAGKPLADGLGRDRTVGPDQLHDLAFEVAQVGQAVIHGATLRSGFNATERRTRSPNPQSLIYLEWPPRAPMPARRG